MFLFRTTVLHRWINFIVWSLLENLFMDRIGEDIFIKLISSEFARDSCRWRASSACYASYFYLWSSWAALITTVGAEYVSYASLTSMSVPFLHSYWAICSKLCFLSHHIFSLFFGTQKTFSESLRISSWFLLKPFFTHVWF